MTDIFEFANQYDLQTNPVGTLNLLGYAHGINVAEDGYAPGFPNENGIVEEVITLRVRGASLDDLANRLRGLDAVMETHRLWKAGAAQTGVWLRAKANTETNMRQALVTRMERANRSTFAQDPFFDQGFYVREYVIAIERTPWEAPTRTAIPPATGQSYLGGRVSYSSVPGDLPARLMELQLTPESTYPYEGIREAWVGVRTPRWGVTVGAFQPVWELRYGSDMFYDVSSVNQTGQDAYNDWFKRCTFASLEGMGARVRISLEQAVTLETGRLHQRGNFLVLLRARVTGATVCDVRIGHAYDNSASFPLQGRVRVADPRWLLYPVGHFSIPPTKNWEAYISLDAGVINTSALEIHAERVSGTGNLDMDIVGLAPSDSGLIHLKSETDGVEETTVLQMPDGEVVAYLDVTSPRSSVAVEPYEWGLLPPSGALIVFAQNFAPTYLASTMTISPWYVPRYSMLRGNT